MRSLHLLNRRLSGLLVVDVQVKLLPIVAAHERVLWNIDRLIKGAALFEVPATATVQYPKGLGPLVPPLPTTFPEPIEKLTFSASTPLVTDWRTQHELVQMVVCGIETHICVLQTAMDLLTAGLDVFIPVDAVSARSATDQQIALDRLQSCGATLTTVESILFEWCESAADPHFKTISSLVRQSPPSA